MTPKPIRLVRNRPKFGGKGCSDPEIEMGRPSELGQVSGVISAGPHLAHGVGARGVQVKVARG